MRYSLEIKTKAIEQYRRGKSVSKISWEMGVARDTIQSWITKYKSNGMLGLQIERRHTLSEEQKCEIIREIIENKLSCASVANKYGLSQSAVTRWTALVRNEGYTALRKIRNYNTIPAYMKRNNKIKGETPEVSRLLHENQLLKAENEYLKKLQTLVEKRIARASARSSKPSKD